MPIIMDEEDWDSLNEGKLVKATTTIKYLLDGVENVAERKFESKMSSAEEGGHNQLVEFRKQNPLVKIQSVVTSLSPIE